MSLQGTRNGGIPKRVIRKTFSMKKENRRMISSFRMKAGLLLLLVFINCRFFTFLSPASSISISWRKLDQGVILKLLLDSIDMFHLGYAMLVFGMELYSIFIGNRNARSRINGWLIQGSNLFGLFDLQMLPALMEMNSMEQLKSRIGHTVLMLLQAGMFEKYMSLYFRWRDLAYFAAAIFISSAAGFDARGAIRPQGFQSRRKMFLGAIPQRPDKATAYRQLKRHLAIVGAWVTVIRLTPYILHLLNKEKEELKLEL
ncbi:hypothetical protein HPP92_000754 [Vanilla planifolia]|uniref:Uncharacterized protein n=1 Tax=Vanilla planifolia TaxID=51239 RepID=A0A835RSQ2_VANPL|nr:hypothetical protein HPP92_000754 [Vanilla planifolia]